MTPDPTWMSVLLNYGPLGAFAVLVTVGITWGVREWWKVYRPHLIKRQQLAIEKEHATVRLFDTLRESEGTKNQILETLTEVQRAHANDCRNTAEKVTEIHRVVVMGKNA